MDDIRISITEDDPIEGWSTVSVGPGYSTRIRGVFPSGSTDRIDSFITTALGAALQLARLEDAADKAEAKAQSGGGD